MSRCSDLTSLRHEQNYFSFFQVKPTLTVIMIFQLMKCYLEFFSLLDGYHVNAWREADGNEYYVHNEDEWKILYLIVDLTRIVTGEPRA